MGKKPEVKSSSPEEIKEASDEVGRIIAKYFTIKNLRSDQAGVYATVSVFKSENEEKFEALRRDLKEISMYPRLVKSGGEWVIVVFPSPKKKKKSVKTNIIFLVLTLITTIWAGAYIWRSRTGGGDPLDIFRVLVSPMDLLLGGLTFAFPLLLILGIHELGHYFTSRYYHVEASLPYFIPIPPVISPFGTFGALISMRENISNKKALVEIGAAGPIAGFIVAIPVTAAGLALTNAFPAEGAEMIEGASYIVFNEPLLFNLLELVIPVNNEGMIFPTALAGWIGLFVTALNLFPVGQLDGGHIVRGILGDSSKYVSYGVIAILIAMGFMTGFITYIVFALFILLLGGRHPPPLDDYSPLSARQYMVAGLAVVMFALTFHPVPIETYVGEEESFEIYPHQRETFVRWDEPSHLNITVDRKGPDNSWITMKVEYNDTILVPSNLNRSFDWDEGSFSGYSNGSQYSLRHEGLYILSMGSLKRKIDGDGTTTYDLVLGCSRDLNEIDNGTLTLIFETDDGETRSTDISLSSYESYIYLERTRLRNRNRYVTYGTAYLFPESEIDMINLSLRYQQVSGEWVMGFRPVGSDPGVSLNLTNATYRDILPGGANTTHLGNVSFNGDEGLVRSFDFALELINYQKGENGGFLRLSLELEGNGITVSVTQRVFTED